MVSVTIPDSVTSIGDDAFCNCAKLISVTIGDGVTSIGDYAFYYCDNLVSVTIPDSVTSIGDYAFYGCDNLISVTIGDGVTSIGALAFYPWSKLKELYCMAIKPPKMTLEYFLGHDAGMFGPVYNGIIYVPRTSVNSYKSAEGWKNYSSSIVGFDF